MNVTPMEEKDLPSNLLPIGEYHIEVVTAFDKKSKSSGNDMIELKVAIWEDDRIRCYLFDYLLDAIPAKVRHACDSFGLLDKYQSGNLESDDFIGRTGKAKIGIEKDKTGKYPDRNKIVDYCVRTAKPINKQSEAPDDDLPF